MKGFRTIAASAYVLAMCILNGCATDSPRAATKLNVPASLPATLPWNPLQGRVITTSVDQRNAAMSTLYGNDQAIAHARSASQQTYPSGSMLSLVTWKQQEDERWFGANIPAAPQSVEFVTIKENPDKSVQYIYRQFQGDPLQQTSAFDGAAPNDRASFLLAQRAAVMP